MTFKPNVYAKSGRGSSLSVDFHEITLHPIVNIHSHPNQAGIPSHSSADINHIKSTGVPGFVISPQWLFGLSPQSAAGCYGPTHLGGVSNLLNGNTVIIPNQSIFKKIMRTYVIGFWAGLVLSGSSCTMKSTDGNDCNPVSNYLISDKHINSAMCGKLDIDQKSGKCFKVVISRRNTFLRVTVFQIINKEELSTSPSSYFKFYNSIFLCYDGSEILRNKHVADRVIDSLMPRMKIGYINDGPVFQLDIKEPGKKVEINDPAVNPYDFKEKPVTDTVNFSKRR